MNQRSFQFGLLGIGGGAMNHVRGIQSGFRSDDVRVSSVCARDLEKAKAFVDAHVPARGSRQAFSSLAQSSGQAISDLEAFLADPEIDAVIVSTPDALHAEHAVAAMRAGKHVLVEKPMALTRRDAEDMARVARECGVRLGVGFHMRHHAGHRALHGALADRAIGEVTHVHLDWSTQSMRPDNWRATDPNGWFALAALGSHALDLVAWLTGAPPPQAGTRANVFATKVTQNAVGRDLRVALHLELDGVAASIRVSVADDSARFVRISGSNGFVECRDTLGGKGGGKIVFEDGGRLPFIPVDPYGAQIEAFVAAIREGRDPEAGAKDGILNADWLEQAGHSMNVGLP